MIVCADCQDLALNMMYRLLLTKSSDAWPCQLKLNLVVLLQAHTRNMASTRPARVSTNRVFESTIGGCSSVVSGSWVTGNCWSLEDRVFSFCSSCVDKFCEETSLRDTVASEAVVTMISASKMNVRAVESRDRYLRGQICTLLRSVQMAHSPSLAFVIEECAQYALSLG